MAEPRHYGSSIAEEDVSSGSATTLSIDSDAQDFENNITNVEFLITPISV